jgi:4-hydroxybenzoate polyprenyltransferase
MNPILNIIRLPNLVVVVLMQWLLYQHFIAKTLAAHKLVPALGHNMAVLFIAVTALITAGGYAINDLLDIKADEINRPNRVIAGRTLSIPVVKWLYFLFVASGYVLALYISMRLGKPGLIIYYLIFVAGLYTYSSTLKREPFIGNLWIAAYCAGAIGMLWFAERHVYFELVKTAPQIALALRSILLFFMAFAFLSTLLREIVKDMQDEPGDRLCGYRTTPVVWGMAFARRAAFATAILLAVLIGIAAFGLKTYWVNDLAPVWLGFVLLELLVVYVLLVKAATSAAFRRVSLLLKAMMLSGILWLLFLQI